MHSESEILDNMARWNRRVVVERMYQTWPPLPEDVMQEQCQQRLGEVSQTLCHHTDLSVLVDQSGSSSRPTVSGRPDTWGYASCAVCYQQRGAEHEHRW